MREWEMKYEIMIGMIVILLIGLRSVSFGQSVFPDSSIVKQRCGACHKPDEKNKIEVIEETRKSPEEWKNVLIRMIRLNHAPLADKDFDPIVKELSRFLCLTPKEMSEIVYINSDENNQYREIPKDDVEKRIYTACVRCHTYAKIASHRMTPSQWDENRNLHLGYYPTVVPQMREMDWPKESKELIEILAQKFPFDTPEWQNWMKNRKTTDLTGKWRIAGYQPGMGYYDGWYTFKTAHQKGEDEYQIEREIIYENGIKIKQIGSGTLFSTYHLRYVLDPTPLTGKIEGVFDLDNQTGGFSGKWWQVVQDANAYGNESFYKDDKTIKVIAAFPQSLKIDEKNNSQLKLTGINFPAKLSAADIQFSDPKIQTVSIVKQDSSQILCQVKIPKDVVKGTVTISVKGISYMNPLVIYDKIDGIRIFPSIGRARVSSGAAYPPQGVQFVARAINFGSDGLPDTADDMILEPVTAQWQLEEEKTRENDDDLKYLSTSIANGLYIPITTYGPIEERHQRREGIGLIAVTATFNDGTKDMKARALLGVTVPDFVTHIK